MNKKLGALALLGVRLSFSPAARPETRAATTPRPPAPAQLRVWLEQYRHAWMRDYLVKTFKPRNPGSTLVIKEQQWTGLVDKAHHEPVFQRHARHRRDGQHPVARVHLQRALLDISDIKGTIGGDDLLPGFVEAGSWDGKLYAAPYYSGEVLN